MFSELLIPPRQLVDYGHVVMGISTVAPYYLKAIREAYISAEIEIPGGNFEAPWVAARTPEGILLLQPGMYGRHMREMIWRHTSILRVESSGRAFNQVRNLGNCDVTGSFRTEEGSVQDYGPRSEYIRTLTRAINQLRGNGLFELYQGEVEVIDQQ